MALAFVRSASSVNEMTDLEFFAHYGETSRIVGFFQEPTNTVAGRIFGSYRRHAAAVCRVFDTAMKANASKMRDGSLPPDCLLSLGIRRLEGKSGQQAERLPSEQTVAAVPEIRIAIDPVDNRVVIDGWGELKGANAELIIALAGPFRQATHDEIAPERYPFTRAAILQRDINCENQATLRRRVLRCRNQIEKLARNAGDPLPSSEAVIENSQWHGYRLNPDRIRIVAISEFSRTD